MTKEKIRKRFEFDLNTSVFKSFSYRNDQVIAIRFETCFDKHSIVELLDDLGFKCVTSKSVGFYSLYNLNVVCICYTHKEYGLYTDYEFCQILDRYKIPPSETFNNFPNYISGYCFKWYNTEGGYYNYA